MGLDLCIREHVCSMIYSPLVYTYSKYMLPINLQLTRHCSNGGAPQDNETVCINTDGVLIIFNSFLWLVQ